MIRRRGVQTHPKITRKEFIKLLTETQSKLHKIVAEKQKGQENTIKQTLSDHETKLFSGTLSKDKQYYARVTLYYIFKEAENQKKTKLLFPFKTDFANPQIKLLQQDQLFSQYKESKILIQKINDLYTDTNLEATFVKIIFEYNLIPSIYHSFFEILSFDNYCSLLSQVSPEIRDALSKVLFVSPLFVNYLRDSIAPIILKYTHSGFNSQEISSGLINRIRNLIKYSMKLKIQSIPKYFERFFTAFKNDKKSILKNCFVDPMIEDPGIFLICESMVEKLSSNPIFTKDVLTKLFNDSFIDFLDKEIFNESLYSKYQKGFLSNKDNDKPSGLIFQRIDNYRLVDTLDFYAFQYFRDENFKFLHSLFQDDSKDQTSSSLPFYYLYKIPFKDTIPASDQYQFGNQTLNPLHEKVEEDFHQHILNSLRKLIKDAPALPCDLDIENGDIELDIFSFKQIIETHLVNIPDPFLATQQMVTYSHIKGQLDDTFFSFEQDKLVKEFGLMINEHEESNEAAKLCKEREKDRETITLLEAYPHFYNERFFYACFFKRCIDSINTNINQYIPSDIKNIFENPLRYDFDFKTFYESFFQPNEYIAKYISNYEPFVFLNHLFYRNITFSNYLAHRPDLQAYDNYVHSLLEEKFSDACKLPDKNRLKELDKVRHYLELNPSFINSFDLDADPFTKFVAFFDSLKRMRFDLGLTEPDDFAPFILYIITLYNPKHFYSTIVYIREFFFYCFSENDDPFPAALSRRGYVGKNLFPGSPYAHMKGDFKFFCDNADMLISKLSDEPTRFNELSRLKFKCLLVLVGNGELIDLFWDKAKETFNFSTNLNQKPIVTENNQTLTLVCTSEDPGFTYEIVINKGNNVQKDDSFHVNIGISFSSGLFSAFGPSLPKFIPEQNKITIKRREDIGAQVSYVSNYVKSILSAKLKFKRKQ